MKLLRKVFAAAVFACVIGVNHPDAAVAQQQPPDPRILLNLDLFADQPGEGSSDHPTGQPKSFIDQIRTLNAMGLIGGGGAGHHEPPAGPSADETDNHASDNRNTGDNGDNRNLGNTLSLPAAQPDGVDQDQ